MNIHEFRKTYIEMKWPTQVVTEEVIEEAPHVDGTPLTVYHFTDSNDYNHGSLDKDKIEKHPKRNDKKIKEVDISEYTGHLI